MITVSRSVKEHINLGNYEFAEITAEVTIELKNDRLDGSTVADQLGEQLDRLLEADRKRYRRLTTEDNSFINDHPAL